MKVLVLGGTVFVGRAVVAQARAAGARVTVFTRGQSGTVPAEVSHVRGDRTVAADLDQLSGRRFDVVVDTCGYVPADVAASAALLAPSCGHYSFVSTVNVFPGWPAEDDYRRGGVHAGDPDATAAPAGYDRAASYGWLKAGCELAVVRAFGAGRCSILRGGSIVGPDDSQVGRLPWWLARVSRGGEVLVPGTERDPIALIDARDLARFALSAAVGTFEATGPTGRDTRGDLMNACREVTSSAAWFTYVEDGWLVDQGVQAWTELPLWAPGAPGIFAHHVEESAAAGLTWRPLLDTVADTWAWQRGIQTWQPSADTPGLEPAREAALLSTWHGR